MSYQSPGPLHSARPGQAANANAPLIVLFERDDTVAVPLLSQLRVVGYDVRGARTPVELFDHMQKHVVTLVLVDLGSAAASRREFWVALDAQRRGRAIQVLTFRFMGDQSNFEPDMDLTAGALADVDVRGPHELQVIIEAVCQRVPVSGGGMPSPASMSPFEMGGAMSANPFGGNGASLSGPASPEGPLAPLGSGRALGALVGGTPGWAAGSNPLGGPGFQIPPVMPQIAPSGPDQQSPFAAPAHSNPFATNSGDVSPFDAPMAKNPFETAGPPSESTAHIALAGSNAPVNGNGFHSHTSSANSARPDAFSAYEQFLGVFGGSVPGHVSGMNGQNGHSAPGSRDAISDAWVPPGSDDPVNFREAANPINMGGNGKPVATAWSPADHVGYQDTAVEFPVYDTATPRAKPIGSDDPELHDATAPISIQLPNVSLVAESASDRALGTVLIEGALLTQKKLEALRGIQSMLSSVEMDFKLGELALLFKFLSPDQLLAALLVSRGLVSPQQIAALGRIKQEMSSSGMDYDLETLLIMFHILPAEELKALREEIS